MTCNPISAFKDNYIWLLSSDSKKRYVAVIDPGDATPVLQKIRQDDLILTAILITHHHWDHTNGIEELLQHYSIPVFGPAHDKIESISQSLAEPASVELPELNLKFQVLDIPGHTLGHIAYYGHNMLFSGDTLFTGGCGKLFEGTPEQMYHSLMKLAELPEQTQVFCGHEYTESNLKFALAVEPNNSDLLKRINLVKKLRASNLPTVPATIDEEKRTNPFLRCSNPAVIQAVEKHVRQSLNDPAQVFAHLRAWKNNF